MKTESGMEPIFKSRISHYAGFAQEIIDRYLGRGVYELSSASFVFADWPGGGETEERRIFEERLISLVSAVNRLEQRTASSVYERMLGQARSAYLVYERQFLSGDRELLKLCQEVLFKREPARDFSADKTSGEKDGSGRENGALLRFYKRGDAEAEKNETRESRKTELDSDKQNQTADLKEIPSGTGDEALRREEEIWKTELRLLAVRERLLEKEGGPGTVFARKLFGKEPERFRQAEYFREKTRSGGKMAGYRERWREAKARSSQRSAEFFGERLSMARLLWTFSSEEKEAVRTVFSEFFPEGEDLGAAVLQMESDAWRQWKEQVALVWEPEAAEEKTAFEKEESRISDTAGKLAFLDLAESGSLLEVPAELKNFLSLERDERRDELFSMTETEWKRTEQIFLKREENSGEKERLAYGIRRERYETRLREVLREGREALAEGRRMERAEGAASALKKEPVGTERREDRAEVLQIAENLVSKLPEFSAQGKTSLGKALPDGGIRLAELLVDLEPEQWEQLKNRIFSGREPEKEKQREKPSEKQSGTETLLRERVCGLSEREADFSGEEERALPGSGERNFSSAEEGKEQALPARLLGAGEPEALEKLRFEETGEAERTRRLRDEYENRKKLYIEKAEAAGGTVSGAFLKMAGKQPAVEMILESREYAEQIAGLFYEFPELKQYLSREAPDAGGEIDFSGREERKALSEQIRELEADRWELLERRIFSGAQEERESVSDGEKTGLLRLRNAWEEGRAKAAQNRREEPEDAALLEAGKASLVRLVLEDRMAAGQAARLLRELSEEKNSGNGQAASADSGGPSRPLAKDSRRENFSRILEELTEEQWEVLRERLPEISEKLQEEDSRRTAGFLEHYREEKAEYEKKIRQNGGTVSPEFFRMAGKRPLAALVEEKEEAAMQFARVLYETPELEKFRGEWNRPERLDGEISRNVRRELTELIYSMDAEEWEQAERRFLYGTEASEKFVGKKEWKRLILENPEILEKAELLIRESPKLHVKFLDLQEKADGQKKSGGTSAGKRVSRAYEDLESRNTLAELVRSLDAEEWTRLETGMTAGGRDTFGKERDRAGLRGLTPFGVKTPQVPEGERGAGRTEEQMELSRLDARFPSAELVLEGKRTEEAALTPYGAGEGKNNPENRRQETVSDQSASLAASKTDFSPVWSSREGQIAVLELLRLQMKADREVREQAEAERAERAGKIPEVKRLENQGRSALGEQAEWKEDFQRREGLQKKEETELLFSPELQEKIFLAVRTENEEKGLEGLPKSRREEAERKQSGERFQELLGDAFKKKVRTAPEEKGRRQDTALPGADEEAGRFFKEKELPEGAGLRPAFHMPENGRAARRERQSEAGAVLARESLEAENAPGMNGRFQEADRVLARDTRRELDSLILREVKDLTPKINWKEETEEKTGLRIREKLKESARALFGADQKEVPGLSLKGRGQMPSAGASLEGEETGGRAGRNSISERFSETGQVFFENRNGEGAGLILREVKDLPFEINRMKGAEAEKALGIRELLKEVSLLLEEREERERTGPVRREAAGSPASEKRPEKTEPGTAPEKGDLPREAVRVFVETAWRERTGLKLQEIQDRMSETVLNEKSEIKNPPQLREILREVSRSVSERSQKESAGLILREGHGALSAAGFEEREKMEDGSGRSLLFRKISRILTDEAAGIVSKEKAGPNFPASQGTSASEAFWEEAEAGDSSDGREPYQNAGRVFAESGPGGDAGLILQKNSGVLPAADRRNASGRDWGGRETLFRPGQPEKLEQKAGSLLLGKSQSGSGRAFQAEFLKQPAALKISKELLHGFSAKIHGEQRAVSAGEGETRADAVSRGEDWRRSASPAAGEMRKEFYPSEGMELPNLEDRKIKLPFGEETISVGKSGSHKELLQGGEKRPPSRTLGELRSELSVQEKKKARAFLWERRQELSHILAEPVLRKAQTGGAGIEKPEGETEGRTQPEGLLLRRAIPEQGTQPLSAAFSYGPADRVMVRPLPPKGVPAPEPDIVKYTKPSPEEEDSQTDIRVIKAAGKYTEAAESYERRLKELEELVELQKKQLKELEESKYQLGSREQSRENMKKMMKRLRGELRLERLERGLE